LQDIGLFAVTESQCTEDEHDDEDDSKFRNLGLSKAGTLSSPRDIAEHEVLGALDVQFVRSTYLTGRVLVPHQVAESIVLGADCDVTCLEQKQVSGNSFKA
jgi:hypothetical protein